MEAWNLAILRIVDVMVILAGALLAVGCSLNGLYIVIYAGVEGGSRVIPEVILRVVGFIAGLLIAWMAPTITAKLAILFLTPIF
jgi:hypothetical protein